MRNETLVKEAFELPPLLDIKEPLLRLKAARKFSPSFTFSEENLVGIEVEVERILTNNHIGEEYYRDKSGSPYERFYLWHSVEDGSLRNNGREYVSAPIQGEDIEFAIEYLFDTLKQSPRHKGYEFTNRTSIHVHMNAREMTLKDLQNFCLLYSVVEPVLYNFCGGERHKNIFCIPVNQSYHFRFLGDFYAQRTVPKLRELARNWKKYLGFNLAPLAKYGTIEFRQLVGTDDQKKILTWIDLILKLKKYACSTRFTANKKEILELNTTSAYMQLITKIFGINADYLLYDGFERHLEQMTMFVKCCFSKTAGQLIDSGDKEFVESILSLKKESTFFSKRCEEMGFLAKIKKVSLSEWAMPRPAFFINPAAEVEQGQVAIFDDIAARVEVEVPLEEVRRQEELLQRQWAAMARMGANHFNIPQPAPIPERERGLRIRREV